MLAITVVIQTDKHVHYDDKHGAMMIDGLFVKTIENYKELRTTWLKNKALKRFIHNLSGLQFNQKIN